MEPTSIIIDGQEYRPVKKTDSWIQIVILQRGWVMVGRFSQKGENCILDDAQVVRVWGTTRGLGEIASGGPTSLTKLDPVGHVEFHVMTVIARIACEESKWSSLL